MESDIINETVSQLSRLVGIVYIPKIEISGDINKSKDDAFGIIEYHINEILSILKIFGEFMTD